MDAFNWFIQALDAAGIYNNVVGSFLYTAILIAMNKRIDRTLARRFRATATTRLMTAIILCGVPFFFFLENFIQSAVYILTLTGIVVSAYLTSRRFSSLGILDAHRTTVGGIDYTTALDMAKKSIDFLGIGADKLSIEPGFASAMRRCGVNGQTVRFLLSPPSNPVLEKMARRNGHDPGAYGQRVIASTLKIAEIRREWDLNIEVRYYSAKHDKDFQRFRLMFIDEETCLWSWTPWGEHKGRENPQVILAHSDRDTGISSAYKAFKDHFDAAWNDEENTIKIDLNTIDRATLLSM